MATTLNAATFMGKNFSTIQSVVKNHEDLTLKQMFDVTAQLVNNQDEINGLDKIQWEKYSWTRLSLIGDETVINLQRTKVYVFSDSVLCLGKVLQHPESNEAWKNRVAGVRSEKSYRDYDAINGEPTEFEWNIFPGFTTLQLCDKILKNSELEAKHQKYEGRVVFRGDIVKDDSGFYAVFSEQGSSGSLMTVAKTMDIISRLPGFDGQAADAVSAFSQVEMEDADKMLNFPKPECPDIWIRLPRHKWPKSWSSIEDPVVPLERILWERQFEKILLKHGWSKSVLLYCVF